MPKKSPQRQRREGLATFTRWHLTNCTKEIRESYFALKRLQTEKADATGKSDIGQDEGVANSNVVLCSASPNSISPASIHSGDDDVAIMPTERLDRVAAGSANKTRAKTKKPAEKRQPVKPSTALAKLIGLPPYHNARKAKPEYAKHLNDFMQGAGPAHFKPIFEYFRDKVITAEYRAAAPLYIQLLIHEVFDVPLPGDDELFGAEARTLPSELDPALRSAIEQALFSPSAIISAIEETSPLFAMHAKLFVGTWHIIRYSHDGKRVVRLAMEVTWSGSGRPLFRLYFRNRAMTVSRSKAAYITRGSLIVLKGGQHVKFFGQEETHQGEALPNGYPISIMCRTNISPHAPFIGLVERRHDDGSVFSIKAQFVPAPGCSISQLRAENKIGSFESDDEIDRIASDIPGLRLLLAQLHRSKGDVKGGVVL